MPFPPPETSVHCTDFMVLISVTLKLSRQLGLYYFLSSIDEATWGLAPPHDCSVDVGQKSLVNILDDEVAPKIARFLLIRSQREVVFKRFSKWIEASAQTVLVSRGDRER
jgi:hypothetical protein